MMDVNLKRRWIAEMLSGRHKKGRGLLEDSEGRCCAIMVLQKVLGGEQFGNFISESRSGLFYSEQIEVMRVSDESVGFEPVAKWVEKNL